MRSWTTLTHLIWIQNYGWAGLRPDSCSFFSLKVKKRNLGNEIEPIPSGSRVILHCGQSKPRTWDCPTCYSVSVRAISCHATLSARNHQYYLLSLILKSTKAVSEKSGRGGQEKICWLEAFSSYGCGGRTQLGLADLDETISPFKEDGFKALKFFVHLDPAEFFLQQIIV